SGAQSTPTTTRGGMSTWSSGGPGATGGRGERHLAPGARGAAADRPGPARPLRATAAQDTRGCRHPTRVAAARVCGSGNDGVGQPLPRALRDGRALVAESPRRPAVAVARAMG